MNPIDKSQHFPAIYKQTEELTELGDSRLSQETVESILSIAQVMTKIGENCNSFQVEIQQQLEPRAIEVNQIERLKKVQEQLSRIIEVTQGSARPSKTIQDLISSLNKWRENFLDMRDKIEIAEQEVRVKQKRLNLDLELKDMQNKVLNSSYNNTQKLELLKELLNFEKQLQSFPNSFQGSVNWKNLEQEIDQLTEQVQAVKIEL